MHPELAAAFAVTAERVAELEEMPVDGGLASALSALRAAPTDAPTAVRVQALWGRVESWVAAERMLATYDAVYGLRGSLDLGSRDEAWMLAAQEIACATHVAYPTAMSTVTLVEQVARLMPSSWEALDRGEITLGHLKAVEKATRRMVIAFDPDGAEERAKTAKADADVTLYPAADEVATIVATGDAELARTVMDAINNRAESMGRTGDDRPVGVRRFHALADLVLNGAHRGGQSTVRAETHVRIDLATLVGLNNHPGELTGYGPITAETARRIAANSTLRRLVTDPLTGDTLDLGLRAYQPSAALQRLIEADHPTCTMPGCSKPSIHCEIDHRHERHDGGRTDRTNLKPLCKMHHQMKTKKRWKVDQNPDGSETWTSYLGFTHTKKPRHFPLPDPLAPEHDPPEDIADRLPGALLNPYPAGDNEPLPEPPPLTEEHYEQMSYALDVLNAMDLTFRQWVDKHYDQARLTGLVA
jgi:hypothetical protein